MGVTPLVPLTDSGYTRIFESEIDVASEEELIVRGRMADHRFEFEHVWKVRTPEYEVVESKASQSKGDKLLFDPILCDRYAGIGGVRIGRGFSKRVMIELGDLPGRQEHLFLAIEMARVAQQVYQFPVDFDEKYPVTGDDPSEQAKSAWLKDRAYMAELVNSCYTYRDQSEELFSTREVRCGFDPQITRPRPGTERIFWRNKQVSISFADHADGFRCTSSMDDRIHDIRIGFDFSTDGTISNAGSEGLRLPYHGICEDAQLRTSGLNGLRVTKGFILQFADRVGGASGCTHLFDLSIDCLRLFNFDEKKLT